MNDEVSVRKVEIDYYLFNNPSTLDGMASTVDLFGAYTEYNTSPTGKIADAIALYEDFQKVGEDITQATHSFQP